MSAVVEKTEWIIFDIDGTLANIQHRLHHIKYSAFLETLPVGSAIPSEDEFKKNWDKFNSLMHMDFPKQSIIKLNAAMFNAGYNIAVVTGRFEKYRKITQDWLLESGVALDKLFMRKDGDYRSDWQVKQDILLDDFTGKPILFVVDDREQVVDMWRKNGITCLQCQKGDY